MRFHEFVQQGDRILPYRSYFCCSAAVPAEQSGGMDGKPIDAQRLQALAEAVREGNVG
jgi:hypothetical protein